MSEHALLFLHALTSLHPGSGTALGAIDLPVQRERHTQWPTVPGSSLKGVMRDHFGHRNAQPWVEAAFGPPPGQGDTHAGALAFTDARILAFPVRSLRGVFAWVTCPAVLERLQRDLEAAGRSVRLPDVSVAPQKARVTNATPLLVQGQSVVLEEFVFGIAEPCDAAAQWLSTRVSKDARTKQRFLKHFAVLHDDDFTHFVRFATEVTARIGLNHDTKTVKPGALFYQECLPPETLLYSLVFADKSRQPGDATTAQEMLARLDRGLPRCLQIGGDETTGKGLTALHLDREETR